MHALDRLTDEVQRGESGLALLILLAAILVAVAESSAFMPLVTNFVSSSLAWVAAPIAASDS